MRSTGIILVCKAEELRRTSKNTQKSGKRHALRTLPAISLWIVHVR
jgi:hypothetical protein